MSSGTLFGMDPEPVPAARFLDDTHRRRLVALLLDTSASMATTYVDGERAIDALNREIAGWLPKVRAEGQGNLRDVEFVVVTFGDGGVRVVSGSGTADAGGDDGAFVPAARLDLQPLQASGASPLAEAVDTALQLLEERRRYVQQVHFQQAGRPRMILVSDGEPTDREGLRTDDWRRLAERLTQWRASGRVELFAFGVPGVDDEVMRALAGADHYFRLDELDVKKLLDLILVATSETESLEKVRDLFQEDWD